MKINREKLLKKYYDETNGLLMYESYHLCQFINEYYPSLSEKFDRFLLKNEIVRPCESIWGNLL